MTWNDNGPVSQGKIITALLQGKDDEANKMLKGWTEQDLYKLSRAAIALHTYAEARISHKQFEREMGT